MYIAIIIYKRESLGHDLRAVAGPENFAPSGGAHTVHDLLINYKSTIIGDLPVTARKTILVCS